MQVKEKQNKTPHNLKELVVYQNIDINWYITHAAGLTEIK